MAELEKLLETFAEEHENIEIVIKQKQWNVLVVPIRNRHKKRVWLTRGENKLLILIRRENERNLVAQLEQKVAWLKAIGQGKNSTIALYEHVKREIFEHDAMKQYEEECERIMAKVVTDAVTLKALETKAVRKADVANKIRAELSEIKKQPNKWFVLDSTTSSTHVRRVLIGMKESVKTSKTPDGAWIVRRIGAKRKNKKLISKGSVYVKYQPK